MACFAWLGLKNCSFIIGILYSLIALAVASATLGLDGHVAYDSYASRGFNTGAAIVSTLTFLASLSLVYGILEGRPGFVSPWLIMQLITPLFTAVFYFWAIASSQERNQYGPAPKIVPEAGVFAAFHIILMVGCTVLVHKYYQELKFKSGTRYAKQENIEDTP